MEKTNELSCEELFELCKKKRENGTLSQPEILNQYKLLLDYDKIPDLIYNGFRKDFTDKFNGGNTIKDSFLIKHEEFNKINELNKNFSSMYIIFCDVNGNKNLSLAFKYSKRDLDNNFSHIAGYDGKAYLLNDDGAFMEISDHDNLNTYSQNFLKNFSKDVANLTGIEKDKQSIHVKFYMTKIKNFGGFEYDYHLDLLLENDKINIGAIIKDIDLLGETTVKSYNRGLEWP